MRPGDVMAMMYRRSTPQRVTVARVMSRFVDVQLPGGGGVRRFSLPRLLETKGAGWLESWTEEHAEQVRRAVASAKWRRAVHRVWTRIDAIEALPIERIQHAAAYLGILADDAGVPR